MRHAARSGKQNIVEGSLEKSTTSNMTLTGVSRASYGELIEDYKDFLRRNRLSLWDKNDQRVLKIRKTQEADTSYKRYESYMSDPESFANLVVTLCHKQGHLLDQLWRSQERKFVAEGGFREKLFRKRQEYRKKTGFDK